MTKEELIEQLKKHLRIEAEVEGGDYGSSQYLRISVKFEGETITTTSTYLPR